MGNHKFRLSEMIPNAWFYKLKDIGSKTRRTPKSTKKKKQPPTSSSSSSSSSSLTSSSLSSSSTKATSTSSTTTTSSIPPQNSKLPNNPHNILSHQRKSYYFTRKLTSLENPKFQAHHTKSPETRFLESPRKSSKQKNFNNAKVRSKAASANRPPSQKLITTSVSASCGCRASLDLKSDDYPISPLDSSSDPESLFPELGPDQDQNPENDIVIDMNVGSPNAKLDEFNSISKLELPPILTEKQPKSQNSAEFEEINAFSRRSISNFKEQRTSSVSSVRRLSVSSPGVRLRTNSPRIGTRRVQGNGRKSVSSASSGCRSRRSVSDSFAVVKSSADPRRDFRESMVEMIVENNMRSSKDLEDLLACYLQLNSDEYHEMIIKVFKQIWFDLSDIRLNN